MIRYNWLSMLGNFEQVDDSIVFIGREIINNDNKVTPAPGNLIFSEYFNEGRIRAEIEFTELDDELGCDIIFNYKNNDGVLEMATVGIDKGLYTMFELKSLNKGKWEFHNFSGDSRVIKADERYFMELTYTGNAVNLKVNSIDVLQGRLPFATTRSQVGIWCRSKKNIVIHDFQVENVKPKVFVIMQFTEQFNELYSDVIKNICEKYNFSVIRADDIYNNGMIIHDITKSIVESKIVIADISPKNQNVYYEVGYAHAINKPTILLAEEGTELPFDVKPYRVIFYKNSISGKKRVEECLAKHLEQIV